jgi:hypothetical protein
MKYLKIGKDEALDRHFGSRASLELDLDAPGGAPSQKQSHDRANRCCNPSEQLHVPPPPVCGATAQPPAFAR